MKGERKLRLVPPAGGDGEEPPPTDAELRDALALREAMDEGADPLAAALRAAFHPAPLDDEENDELLSRALRHAGDAGDAGDAVVDAPPTKVERAGAARLSAELEAKREASAGSEPKSEEAALAGALRAAWAPRPIDPLKNEALIAEAVHKAAPVKARRGRVLAVTMVSLGTMAAMAAGIILLVGRMAHLGEGATQSAAAPPAAPMVAAQASLIRARSAAELFDAATPFPRTGGESARIDRIASARAAELRANRFAAWGVQ